MNKEYTYYILRCKMAKKQLQIKKKKTGGAYSSTKA